MSVLFVNCRATAEWGSIKYNFSAACEQIFGKEEFKKTAKNFRSAIQSFFTSWITPEWFMCLFSRHHYSSWYSFSSNCSFLLLFSKKIGFLNVFWDSMWLQNSGHLSKKFHYRFSMQKRGYFNCKFVAKYTVISWPFFASKECLFCCKFVALNLDKNVLHLCSNGASFIIVLVDINEEYLYLRLVQDIISNEMEKGDRTLVKIWLSGYIVLSVFNYIHLLFFKQT